MKYTDLDERWKKIFELDWEAACHGSKAISALLIDEKGNTISEGFFKIGRGFRTITNPAFSLFKSHWE